MNQCQFNEFNGSMDIYNYSWVLDKDKYTDKTGTFRDIKRVVKLKKKSSALKLVASSKT